MESPTEERPLDDHGKAQHLTQLQTTLQTLAGTGLFTQKDAAQYFTQIARLVHIRLAAQCNLHHDTYTDNDDSNRSEDQNLSLEYINSESSESERLVGPPQDISDKPKTKGTIRKLKRLFPKWTVLRRRRGDQ